MEGKNKKPPRNDEESDSISKRLINVNQLVRLFGQVSIYLEWRESRLILEGKKCGWVPETYEPSLPLCTNNQLS